MHAITEYSLQSLSILRDLSHFKWYVIPLLSFIFYVYVVEAEKRNWSLVLAGLAFWVFDMKTMKSKLLTVGTIWVADVLALILFIPILGWI